MTSYKSWEASSYKNQPWYLDKNHSRRFMSVIYERTLTPVLKLNFINVLRTAFTLADPKSVKRYWGLDWVLTLLGSACVKAVCRMLMKLTPGIFGVCYFAWFLSIPFRFFFCHVFFFFCIHLQRWYHLKPNDLLVTLTDSTCFAYRALSSDYPCPRFSSSKHIRACRFRASRIRDNTLLS